MVELSLAGAPGGARALFVHSVRHDLGLAPAPCPRPRRAAERSGRPSTTLVRSDPPSAALRSRARCLPPMRLLPHAAGGRPDAGGAR